MNKIRLYILLSILPFLAFMTNVQAIAWDYEFTGYNKVSQLQFGLYNDSTLIQNALTSCTSSNDGYCSFDNDTLPSGDLVFNNLRFVIRGTDGATFTAGSQYKMSFFFGSTTSDYYITQSTLSNTSGVSYQNFSSWTSNDLSIISTNVVPIETKTYSGVSSTLYRVDIVFVVSSSTLSGFSIRLYRQAKNIWASTPGYLDLFRYLSITQMTPGSIDYTQDFNNVINNQNENTQDIIDNQNTNTQAMINEIKKGQLTCGYNYSETFDYAKAPTKNSKINTSGTLDSNSYFNVSDYTLIFGGNSYDISWGNYGSAVSDYLIALYDSNKSFITTVNYRQNSVLDLSNYSGLMYIRINLNNTSINRVVIVSKNNICVPTSYLQMKQNDDINNNLSDINDSLTDDDVSSANSSASNFFSSFTTETYGLTSVITAPLSFIQGLTSKTCSPLVLPLPYVNRNLELPCMRGIYEQHFGGFLSLYQTITFGIISYWIVVRIFNLVKDFKNPDHDEIEVMDL